MRGATVAVGCRMIAHPPNKQVGCDCCHRLSACSGVTCFSAFSASASSPACDRRPYRWVSGFVTTGRPDGNRASLSGGLIASRLRPLGVRCRQSPDLRRRADHGHKRALAEWRSRHSTSELTSIHWQDAARRMLPRTAFGALAVRFRVERPVRAQRAAATLSRKLQ